jgi:integrase
MAKLRLTNRNKDKVDRNGKKKKPNWEWRFEIRINGERKNFSKSGFATKAEAEEAGTAALAEYNGGGYVKPKEISVSDFLDLWVSEYVTINLRHKTQLCYVGIINNHLKPAFGHYQLKNLQAGKIQEFVNNLKKRDFSKRHTENILSTLKNALNYAIEPLQFIKVNPAQFVKLPRFEKQAKQRIVIEQENFEKIISRFPEGNKWHLPLMIGYHTGMRISEVFALTWDDIDLENAVIDVTKQTIRYKPDDGKIKWCLGPTKTRAGARRFKIGSTLLELLKRENIRQKQNRLLYGEFYRKYGTREFKDKNKEVLFEIIAGTGDINLVCVDHDGGMITTDSFKYCSRVIHHELKLDFDFHSLRHTHATILAESGANPKALQIRMGHDKIETTFKTYIHKTQIMEDESIELFERALTRTK